MAEVHRCQKDHVEEKSLLSTSITHFTPAPFYQSGNELQDTWNRNLGNESEKRCNSSDHTRMGKECDNQKNCLGGEKMRKNQSSDTEEKFEDALSDNPETEPEETWNSSGNSGMAEVHNYIDYQKNYLGGKKMQENQSSVTEEKFEDSRSDNPVIEPEETWNSSGNSGMAEVHNYQKNYLGEQKMQENQSSVTEEKFKDARSDNPVIEPEETWNNSGNSGMAEVHRFQQDYQGAPKMRQIKTMKMKTNELKEKCKSSGYSRLGEIQGSQKGAQEMRQKHAGDKKIKMLMSKHQGSQPEERCNRGGHSAMEEVPSYQKYLRRQKMEENQSSALVQEESKILINENPENEPEERCNRDGHSEMREELAYKKTREHFLRKCLLFAFLLCLILFIIVIVLGIMLALQHCDSVSSVQHDLEDCPEDWIVYRKKCYFFSKEEANWISSQNFCSSHNASLARIEKKEEDFIMHLKGKDSYWIGLRRDPKQPWKWTSGENATLKVLGDGGNCAYLSNEPKATASSSRCSTEYRWICSKSTTPSWT